MRAAIAWSYDLLDPAEQSLFRRLSVFSGGFTLEAAATVQTALSGTPVSPFAMEDEVEALTDKGLLLSWDDAHERRFFMLETIREFGKDELQASGELDVAERTHTRWFVELIEQAEPELTGPKQGEWFERLDTEIANLRAALQRLVDDPDATQDLMRMSSAMWRFWWNRGYGREGRSVLERALERPAGDAPHLRAKALHAAAEMADVRKDLQQGEIWLNEALAIRRELGDKVGIAEILNSLGHAARDRGVLARAQALHEDALALLQPLDEPRATATTLNALGGVAYYRGDAERADALWRDTLARVRALDDSRSIVALLGNLGALAVMRQDPDQAIEYHEEALRIARQMGDIEGTTRTLINLGGAMYERRDYEQARPILEEALARSRQSEDTGAQALILYDLCRLADAQGHDGTALLSESLSLFWRAGNLIGAADCIEAVGMHARRQGQPAEALRLFAAAAAIRDTTGAARSTVDHGEYDEELNAARDTVPPAEFDAIWSQGTHIEPSDAVAEALAIASRWIQAQPIAAEPTTTRSGSASPERFA